MQNKDSLIRLFALLSFGVSFISFLLVEILLHDGVVEMRDRTLFSIAIFFATISVALSLVVTIKATYMARRIFWIILIIVMICIIMLSAYSYLLTYLRWGDNY